jgi:hypothetical protein
MFRTKLTLAVLAVAIATGAQAAVAQSTAASASSSFITDTLAPGGGTSAPAQGYRFVTDTLAPGGGTSEVFSTQSSSGFDWSDAGIGAGATAGLMLGLLGSARLLTGRRHPAAA